MTNTSIATASPRSVTSNLHAATAGTSLQETPKQRVARLYSEDGGPLLGWLIDEARQRGQLLQEMAAELGVTYGYINQLRGGFRKVSAISQEFARACARYLGVPPVVIKVVSGNISLSDFAWPAQDENILVERAYQTMLRDPAARTSLPRNADDLPVAAKKALVLLYSDATGIDVLGARQLPEIVHWLQRAAIVHDGHEGDAERSRQTASC